MGGLLAGEGHVVLFVKAKEILQRIYGYRNNTMLLSSITVAFFPEGWLSSSFCECFFPLPKNDLSILPNIESLLSFSFFSPRFSSFLLNSPLR